MRLSRTVTGEDPIPNLGPIIYLKKWDIFVQNLCCLEVHDYSDKEKKKCVIMHYGKAENYSSIFALVFFLLFTFCKFLFSFSS